MKVPETSIVIRTYNEEAHLPGLLEALDQQEYRDFEIVVVDSSSLDRTRDIAEPKVDKLIRIDSQDFTFGYSLNVGIQGAAGQYAVLVSAHTAPFDQAWLGELIEPLREGKTAMSYGRQLGGVKSKFSEVLDLKRTFGHQYKVLHPPHYFGHNANSAIQKSLWAQYPFDEILPGLEDIAWVKFWMERGYRVVYNPAAALYHIHDEHWRQIRRRYYRESVAARWIGIKGRRHVVDEAAGELRRTVVDFGHALIRSGSQDGTNKTLMGRAREIVLFRANKLAGTVAGLLDGSTAQDNQAQQEMFFDRTGQAVVITRPGHASLEEVAIPEMKPGDVVIRTAYTGVTGTDLDVFQGTLPYYRDGTAKFPIVPGHEMSGRIVATGSNVDHVQEGDGVVVDPVQNCGICVECRRSNRLGCLERTELGIIQRNGSYSEYVVVPGRFVYRLPPGFDLRQATLCGLLAVVLKGLNRLYRYRPAESGSRRCAVVGAGSLGHLSARVLDRQGHSVTVFDREPTRRAYFNGSSIQVSDDMAGLAEFDLLAEVTGDSEALEAMLRQSAPGATILLLGLPYSRRQGNFERIVTLDNTVVGSSGSGVQEFQEAINLLPDLEVGNFLQCILPLDQYREAWDIFRQRKFLKVLLEVNRELP